MDVFDAVSAKHRASELERVATLYATFRKLIDEVRLAS
jgi:hypothetical protein